MNSSDKLLQALLDGENLENGSSPLKGSDAERFSLYRERLDLLGKHRQEAPHDFVGRVMATLPDRPRLTWHARLRSLWPEGRRWILPALAGALTALIAMLGVTFIQNTPGARLVAVTFEVYAPTVKNVELVGTFSDWKRGLFPLKGPDAIGYWGCGLSLPPGQYEYLFLIDGKTLVRGQDEGPHRPDGFGYENSLLLLRGGMPRQVVRVHISSPSSGILIRGELRARDPSPFPEVEAKQWRTILDKGISAGFREIPLEEVLAGLATARVTPDEASTILAPLFQEVYSGIHARDLLLKVQEGILKGAPFEKLGFSVQNRHQWFNQAKDLLTRTGYVETVVEAPTLLLSAALGLESGLHPLFLEEALGAGKDRSLDWIKVVVEVSESLHLAGLSQEQLRLLMRDCIIRELQWEEIQRVGRHVKGKLREGRNSEAILDGLWLVSGPAST